MTFEKAMIKAEEDYISKKRVEEAIDKYEKLNIINTDGNAWKELKKELFK